jgi:hypothetical protein
MAVYYVNGISDAGATSGQGGYFYPLYLTSSEADNSSSNAAGTHHEHTFYEFPGVTFYMPTTGATHAASYAPTGQYGGENYTQYTSSAPGGVGGIPYIPTPSASNDFISFSTATCTGGYKIKPFRDHGDTDTNIYYHEMKVLTISYAPLADDDTMTAATQKPARSPFADDYYAYYVGDQSVSNGGDGFTTFLRVFANIPQDRYDPTGLYAFDFSGVTTSSTATTTTTNSYSLNITAQGYNGPWTSPSYYFGSSAGAGNVVIGTVSNASGLAVGDTLVLGFDSPIKPAGSNPGPSSFSTKSATIRTIAGNTITFRFGSVGWQSNYDEFWAQTANTAAFSKNVVTSTTTTTQGEIETRNSPSRELKTYIKTSQPTTVTLANMTQLPESLSTTSTPTLAQYNTMVANGDYLNGAPETITRFMGNIYEKSLIQVRAIS